VPRTIAALAAAAAAEGRHLPVVLGPPAGGDGAAGCISISVSKTQNRLELSSASLMRSVLRAASALGTPIALVLRAEPTQRRCRAWLAMPGSTGEALEAGVLPEGVRQLSEGALVA